MKIFQIVTVIFIYTTSFSQDKYTQRYAVSAEIMNAKLLGDNFFNQGYQPDFGYGLEFQVNFNKFFIGFGSKSTTLLIRDQPTVGNFSSAT